MSNAEPTWSGIPLIIGGNLGGLGIMDQLHDKNLDTTGNTAAAHMEEAVKFYDAILSDRARPVVLFALEWCTYCWSARKLFAALEIDFHAVDLDSVPFAENDLGGKIREVLTARTGARTIPQIFIAGNRIGGATELFDACKSGALQDELRTAGVTFKNVPDLDPYHLLPN